MRPESTIQQFLRRVRRRLDLRSLYRVAASATAIGSLALIVAAVPRLWSGYAVEAWWYAAVLGGGALGGVVVWLSSRASVDEAAAHADRQFDLKDTLLSWLHFQERGERGGFYELQAAAASRVVSDLDPAAIQTWPTRRLISVAVALAVMAVGLGFKGPSDEVLQRLRIEQVTLEESTRLSEELEELVRQLDEQTVDQEERELISPDELREIVESFEATENERVSLRQFARLEQHLQRQIAKLNQRRDEQLLAEAARELEKSAETKRLAKPLERRQYHEAADRFSELRPDPRRPLSERRKDAARIRAASLRMAATARARGGAGGKAGTTAGASGQGGGELSQAMLDLDSAVKRLEDALDEAQRQTQSRGECDSECKRRCASACDSAQSKLDRLCQGLSRMGVKQAARERLERLCRACSGCQASLCQATSACQSPKAGKKPGSATNPSRGASADEPLAAGPTEQLRGIKGAGPSQSTVEEADEGTGVASRASIARSRSFARSVESYVSREDVPANVRRGVKRYFETIHDLPTSVVPPGNPGSP